MISFSVSELISPTHRDGSLHDRDRRRYFRLLLKQTSRASLTHNLSFGSRGADVVALQNFLIGRQLFASGSATGYFGKLTLAALQAYQRSKAIVSSGSPATTGYGALGPRTRATMGLCARALPTVNSCPTHQAIACSPGYHSVPGKPDVNGCSAAPECASNAPKTCTNYQLAPCGGTLVPQGSDADGCMLAPRCVNLPAPNPTATTPRSIFSAPQSTAGDLFSVTGLSSPGKLIDSSAHGYQYAYGPSIIAVDGTWHAYFCSSGVSGGWDAIRHSSSPDGVAWSNPDIVLATSDLVNERASCDPSIVYFDAGDGSFYYLFYSGNQKDTQTVNFVARSASPSGPFAKFTSRGTWEVNALDPKIILSPLHPVPDSVPNWYGLGQPTVVAKDGQLYQWFSDDTSGYSGTEMYKIYLSTSSDPTSWPTRHATNLTGTLSVDVKYDAQSNQFIMFEMTQEDSPAAHVTIRTSADGLQWSDPKTISPSGSTPSWSNNIGVSGSRTGALLRDFVLFAYGAPYDLYPNYNDDCKISPIHAAGPTGISTDSSFNSTILEHRQH